MPTLQQNSTGKPSTLRVENFLANKFWVSIPDKGLSKTLDTYFLECSGMSATTETLPVKEGGLNTHVHQLPVRTTFSNVTLKRGMSTSTDWWDWYTMTIGGKIQRRNLSITIFSAEKNEGTAKVLRRWLIDGAYPVKWTGPTFNAKSNEFLIESIELTYNWFTIEE